MFGERMLLWIMEYTQFLVLISDTFFFPTGGKSYNFHVHSVKLFSEMLNIVGYAVK